MNTKFDRRRKYYLVLDCETATLPYASNYEGSARQKIAIAKPLIYDIGWQVVDRRGNIYAKRNFLITEIFSVPSVFNTAYYKDKKPLYLNKLKNGEITLVNWATAMEYLQYDLQYVESVGAYNSMFDFKKALPFTELYINKLYSANFNEWLEMQNKFIEKLVNEKPNNNKDFDGDNFHFRNEKYPLFDIWGLACEYILNNNEYKQMCLDYGWLSPSEKFFKTSAEMAYRYFKNDIEFDESHTALDDAEIETELFTEIVKKSKNNYEMGIIYFPFRILGKVEDFELAQAIERRG